MPTVCGSGLVAALGWMVALSGGESAGPEAQAPGVGPRVHIVASRPAPVELFELTNGRTPGGKYGAYLGGYRSLCAAPCGEVVEARPGRLVFFGGAGITPSRLLELPALRGDLTVRVRPGRRGVRIAGIALISVGVIGVVAGGLHRSVESSISDAEVRHGGSTAILATSVPMLVGGIVMYVLGRTNLRFSPRGAGRRGSLAMRLRSL